MFVLHHRGFLIYPIHPHMPSPAQISIENVETVFPDSATVHHTWELTVPLADMTRSIVDETKSEVKQIWNTKLNVHGRRQVFQYESNRKGQPRAHLFNPC